MKLIESYALNCGLKIGKPQIYEQFFAMPWPDYIILHAGGGMQSKKYDHYQEVIEILRPLLNGIQVVQIGDRGERYIQGCVNLLGQTNIHQTAYLIRNSRLIIGNDSCNLHIASGFGKPIVGLFGPTTPHNHGPAFSTENVACLVADLKGNKPSYSAEESVKTINTIKPEDVARAALRNLGIDESAITRQTLHLGPQFQQSLVECLPNQVLDRSFIPNVIPTVRLDYHYDESFLCRMLDHREYSIVTDRPIPTEILRRYKPRIKSILYDVKSDFSADFVGQVQACGIQYGMVSLLREAALANAKLQLFDYGVVVERSENGHAFRQKNAWTKEPGLKCKSNRILLSEGKVFLSKYHLNQDQPTTGINDRVCDVPQDDSFFDFEEALYIYK